MLQAAATARFFKRRMTGSSFSSSAFRSCTASFQRSNTMPEMRCMIRYRVADALLFCSAISSMNSLHLLNAACTLLCCILARHCPTLST